MPILVFFKGLHGDSNFQQASLPHGVQKYGKLTFKCKINNNGSSVTKRKVIVIWGSRDGEAKGKQDLFTFCLMYYLEQHMYILSKKGHRMVPRKT